MSGVCLPERCGAAFTAGCRPERKRRLAEPGVAHRPLGRVVLLRAPAPRTQRGESMSRPVVIVGCWPRRMCAELAATYCGEPNTDAFLKRVGKEYPQPRVNDGRRRLWLRDDLDQAILPSELAAVRDVAEDM
jgi:hypothetical protein